MYKRPNVDDRGFRKLEKKYESLVYENKKLLEEIDELKRKNRKIKKENLELTEKLEDMESSSRKERPSKWKIWSGERELEELRAKVQEMSDEIHIY